LLRRCVFFLFAEQTLDQRVGSLVLQRIFVECHLGGRVAAFAGQQPGQHGTRNGTGFQRELRAVSGTRHLQPDTVAAALAQSALQRGGETSRSRATASASERCIRRDAQSEIEVLVGIQGAGTGDLADAGDDATNYKKLAAKRLDGFLADPFSAAAGLKKEGFSGRFKTLMTVYSDDIYFLISKAATSPEFVAAFDQALAELKTSGEYQAILDKYLN